MPFVPFVFFVVRLFLKRWINHKEHKGHREQIEGSTSPSSAIIPVKSAFETGMQGLKGIRDRTIRVWSVPPA